MLKALPPHPSLDAAECYIKRTRQMQNDVFFSFFHTKKLQKTIGHITGDFSKMMCPIFYESFCGAFINYNFLLLC